MNRMKRVNAITAHPLYRRCYARLEELERGRIFERLFRADFFESQRGDRSLYGLDLADRALYKRNFDHALPP